MKHYRQTRERAQVKKGLKAWFELALKRQNQRGILIHLVSKRDLADKLKAFKKLQRTSFLGKMCHILKQTNDWMNHMTKTEMLEHDRVVQALAFEGLK